MIDGRACPCEIDLLDPKDLGKDGGNSLRDGHLDRLARIGSTECHGTSRRAGHAGGDVIGKEYLRNALLGSGQSRPTLILENTCNSGASDLLLELVCVEAKVGQVETESTHRQDENTYE